MNSYNLNGGFASVALGMMIATSSAMTFENNTVASKTYKASIEKKQVSNNTNFNKTLDDVILKNNIENIVTKASPYQIDKIEINKYFENKESMTIIDVYTIEENKDYEILFNIEAKILEKLPENYVVRYL